MVGDRDRGVEEREREDIIKDVMAGGKQRERGIEGERENKVDSV